MNEESTSGVVNEYFALMEYMRDRHLTRIRIYNAKSGPMRIYSVKNSATGVEHTLNLDIAEGETVEIRFEAAHDR